MSTTPMTPSTEVYLLAYNGQVNLKRAFSWSLTQIRVFMIEVIDNPSNYGVDREVVPELRRLRTDILDLSEQGSKYQSEDSYPQAISRILNPARASEVRSSTLRGRTTKIIPFGNCAETYPLAHLLRNRNSREEVYGLAVIGIWGGKVENFITDEMPENSTAASSEMQSPTSRDPGPRASGSGIALPTRLKRPSPDDDTDTAEPTPKKAKGPEIPRKPSHLARGKGKPQ
ncbi:hypothetical protein PENFLA_c025G09184 [Penicillium flavigenum]|uniref:Uncharacterized protein n=1 Tax=Penicillium flavigenum TaxID=254877 RepID=A0A1V6STL8_9EURO|nr:hypothetical protein PENFLA_c025G09184 [Penicillium flavigenum]